MRCALIMAGGSGQRFWPLSTYDKPKQLLNLFSDHSMIYETVERIHTLIPYEQIFIGTNEVQAKAISDQLPFLPSENIIVEPAFKDTAAAIGYGAAYINERFEGTKLIVLASDHLIKDVEGFIKVLEIGLQEVENNGSIITLGIKPTRPETGYGYIEVKESALLNQVCNVNQFLEKPSQEKATIYYNSGRYLWNSGMFIFSIQTIMEEIATYMPGHYLILEDIANEIKKGFVGETLSKATRAYFDDFEKISIDYGIMEKTQRIKVIPCDIGWNDIGSYTAFEEVMEHNANLSIIRHAKAKEINASNNIVILEDDEIALIGVHDLVVVKSHGKLLVCHKDSVQDIKKIFKD